MSGKPVLPENLKEQLLLRRVAKVLGLKRTASIRQCLAALDQLDAKRRRDDQVARACRGTIVRPLADLAALRAELSNATGLRELAAAVQQSDRGPAIELPESLRELRARAVKRGQGGPR